MLSYLVKVIFAVNLILPCWVYLRKRSSITEAGLGGGVWGSEKKWWHFWGVGGSKPKWWHADALKNKYLKQAGAELGQAQVKLAVIVEG